jgi:hypothetical protein
VAAGSTSGGIFISYRRQDASDIAGRLYDRLVDRFGVHQVFMDVDTPAPGADFGEAIESTVAACQVLLAVIGPGWLTVAFEDGGRRLDEPGDSVRLEIETALARGVRIIPILVNNAFMPHRRELPGSLAGLARRNAFRIGNESFRYDAGVLITAIERVLAISGAVAVPTGPDDREQEARARARDGRSVFISYRRKLSESLALLVYKDLIEHRFDAFMDFENLDSGEFDGRILSQIEAREHFIVVLEPGSLDRISQDGDWLRREIAHALAHGRNVVPVTKGFEFSHDLVLPRDVARLASFNAIHIPPGYFDAAMERLRTRFLKMSSNPTPRS